MAIIFYAYFETEYSKFNLTFFLEHGGLLPKYEYIFVVNGPSTVVFPSFPNITVIHRPNIGYDFGGHRAGIDHVLSKDPEALKHHDFFVFMNGSVIGPITPEEHGWDWVHHFHTLFTRDSSVRLFGTTIVCLNEKDAGNFILKDFTIGPKIEGYFWCTDSHGLHLLLEEGTILCDHDDKISAIGNGEYGLTNCLLHKHNFNLGCMLTRYKDIDWRLEKNWNMNNCKHPSRHNSFYGKSIDPYEVIFHKWRWERGPPVNKDMIDSHIQRVHHLKGAISHIDKFIYFHIRSGDEERLKRMMDRIESSGILEDIVELRYIVVGKNPKKAILIMQQYSKTKCVQREPSMWTWETATLQRLREDSLLVKDKAFMLYICSPLKFSGWEVSGWEAMLDGLINYRHLCWQGLFCGADVVGGLVRRYPRFHCHGNFWWSTASHLCSLPPITDSTREPELWLLGSVPNPQSTGTLFSDHF